MGVGAGGLKINMFGGIMFLGLLNFKYVLGMSDIPYRVDA